MAGRRTKLEGLTDRLNEAIQASGKTPAQLRREVGVSKAMYYCHLNGDHSMSELFLARYCAALNVSADWLLGLKRGRV